MKLLILWFSQEQHGMATTILGAQTVVGRDNTKLTDQQKKGDDQVGKYNCPWEITLVVPEQFKIPISGRAQNLWRCI